MTTAAPHAERYSWGPGSGFERLVAAIEARDCGPLRNGMVRCPAHEDRAPSLSVSQGERGAVIHCFAGCKTEAVLRALALDPVAIFDTPPEKQKEARANGHARPERVAEYVFTDRHGEPLARKVRLEPGYDGRAKSFLWEVPEGDGWRKAERGEGNPCVLYNLALVVEADHVHLCEGEKAADALVQRGVIATCAPTTTWEDGFTAALRGKRVTLWVDRDAPGETQARAVFDSLTKVGIAAELVRARAEAAHADAFDHLAAGFAPDQGEPFTFAGERAEQQQAEAEPPRTLRRLAFTGARFAALADRTAPAPIVPGIPPPGHVTLLIAPKGFGKSTLSDIIAAATATGARPWDGGPLLGPGRVLILSPDEAPEVTARRIRRLALLAPKREGWSLDRAAERLFVLGSDRDAEPALLDAMRLDDDGFALLEATLAEAQEAGDPFVGVHLDAWIDFLPFDVSENDNRAAARIAGRLEHLAVRFGCYVLALHHEGKPQPNATEGRDPRFAGRGASALNAKARCVFSLELVTGASHLRRIRSVSNLAPVQREALFEVADPKGATDRDEIVYWRPAIEARAYPIEKYLAIGEEISTSELGRRLAGIETGDPPGDVKRLAIRLRDHWHAEGWVEVTEGGKGKATTLRRVS